MEPFQRPMHKRGVKDESSPNFQAYVDEVLASHELIKHIWTQLSDEATLEVLRHELAGPVLLLKRRDIFSAAISAIAARITQNYYKRPEKLEKPIPLRKIREYMRMLRSSQQHWTTTLASLGFRFKVVDYEDLYSSKDLGEAQSKLQQVIDFFGFPGQATAEAASFLMPENRYSSFDYYKTAPNWRAIEQAFARYLTPDNNEISA